MTKTQSLQEFIHQTVQSFIKEVRLREDASGTGLMTLYHYSTQTVDSFVLDPKKFGNNPHSRREMNTSDVPRVFFYTDPKQREKELFGARYNLYIAKVSPEDIYNLSQDPLKLFQKYGRNNLHEILEFISGWKRDKSGWVRKSGNENGEMVQSYKGAMYDVGRFKVVIWFEPIQVTKVSPEEKAAIEKEDQT